MAQRNVVQVSILMLLISMLFACGGGNDAVGPMTVNCTNPIPFYGNNETLLKDGSITLDYKFTSGCYQVNVALDVTNNATLTIEPNTTLQFTQNAGITVSNGSIKAVGSSQRPIYFTSKTGAWLGIRIKNPSLYDNILDNVVIEYAGYNKFDLTRPKYSLGIMSGGPGNGHVILTNSIIRKSAGDYAIYAEENSNIERIDNNQIIENNNYPVQMNASEIYLLNKSNQFRNNINNQISVKGSNIKASEPNGSVTWQNLGIPYYTGPEEPNSSSRVDLSVQGSTNFIVEAGVEIQFSPNEGLIISGSANSIQLLGTQSLPIHLTMDPAFVIGTGLQNTYWNGLLFSGASSPANKIENAIIEYGGHINDPQANKRSNITIDKNSLVSISGSKFLQSQGYGIQLENGSILPNFQNNLMTRNAAGAAKVSSKALKYLDATSGYSGNNNDYIDVTSDGVSNGDRWQGPIDGTPYYFDKSMTIGQPLTIEAGARLLFKDDAQLVISGPDSSLMVNGTLLKPVEFSSISEVLNPGIGGSYWRGISFIGSPNTNNKLSHVKIKYAGIGQSCPKSQFSAAICISDYNSRKSYLNVDNTDIINPYFRGLFKDAESTLVRDTFSNLEPVCDWQITPFAC